MATILITGANGQLGNEFRVESKESPHQFIFTDAEELDVTNEAIIKKTVKENKPDYLINCAAYTAVDKAETDIDLARKINSYAPGYLAEACRQNDAKLIHISTDYVFDGSASQPYIERKFTIPTGMYGKTKLEGEEAVHEAGGQYMIVRTSWLYSSFGNNFVKTMIRLGKERDELGVIYDQIGSPTYARDLATTILEIIDKVEVAEKDFTRGVYHYSNEGVASWYDFSKAIFEFQNIDCHVKPIKTEDYPTPAQRPHYSLLAKEKIKKIYGVEIPYWRDSLKKCLALLK